MKASFKVVPADRDPDFSLGMLILGFFLGLGCGVLIITTLLHR